MEQKKVKITGLTVNQNLGILQAVEMQFDTNNKLTVFKGETGSGKTTAQKAVQLGTQGAKTLTDKNVYGSVDLETQLLDGEHKIYVGCKTNAQGKLEYILYMKDNEGKKVKNPIIDGIQATPKKYLEVLQTKLTWRMDELTSENSTIQKNILFELYKTELAKIGIDEMQKKIEAAKQTRDEKDAYRKQVGGIAEDLRVKGFDVSRPDTLPKREDIGNIEAEIKRLEKEKTTKETEAKGKKEAQLNEIKVKAAEVTNKCFAYNREMEVAYNKEYEKWKSESLWVGVINKYFDEIDTNLAEIVKTKRLDATKKDEVMQLLSNNIDFEIGVNEPVKPQYIKNDGEKITETNARGYDKRATGLIQELIDLRKQHQEIESQPDENIDVSDYDKSISDKQEEKTKAENINKICDAVDAFFDWKDANDRVQELNKQYAKMLAQVDTGVEGLRIVPEESDTGVLQIYLAYNGHYDPEYFRNPGKEYRKVSSYSGTQKPMIALLVQNYLLSQKPKALRYMFIDDHPIDKKTRGLLEKMCEELDIHIFVNVTGDFDKSSLKDGEMLIEGGELILK